MGNDLMGSISQKKYRYFSYHNHISKIRDKVWKSLINFVSKISNYDFTSFKVAYI